MILPNCTTFYFTDHTSFVCEREMQSAFAIASLVGKEADTPRLLIKNIFFKTITEIKDGAVYSELRQSTDRTKKIHLHHVDTAPISLQLKPNEQTLLSLPDIPTLSGDKYLQDTSITMTINEVPHQFNVYYGDKAFDAFSYSDHWIPTCLKEPTAGQDFVQLDNSYEIEDSIVHVYLRIKTPQTHPVYLKKPVVSASFDYYDLHDISPHDRLYFTKCHAIITSLPPFHLKAGAEKFFTFSFALPNDFKRVRGNLMVHCSDTGVAHV